MPPRSPISPSPSKTRNFSPPSSTLSPPTTCLSPFAPPTAQFTSSPHLYVQDNKIILPPNEDDEKEKMRLFSQDEIHSAARRLRKRLPRRGGDLVRMSSLLKLEAAFVRGKPLVTSKRSLLSTQEVNLSTPQDSIPHPGVLAICSDVLVFGLIVEEEGSETLYFDWRLEGQRIIKLGRCEVDEDPHTKTLTLSTPLTTIYIHPSPSCTTPSLYQTLLRHLNQPSSSLPPTPPASPDTCALPPSPTSTALTSPTSLKPPQSRPKRAVPPSSFHSRPLSQTSAHSATSTTSVSSIRSVASFRSGWEPIWVKDDECAGCMVCGEAWGWKRRRHHCRACGRLICYACSSFRPSIFGSVKPMRCCDTCSVAMDREDSDDDEAEMGGLKIYDEEDEAEEEESEEGTVRAGSERGEEDDDDERSEPGEEKAESGR